MKNSALTAVALIFGTSCPALAQQGIYQYNYSYGGTRVILQSQNGLSNPSSTYIGGGTLSRSAQGGAPGMGGMLPVVNMGAHIRSPGDNMYNNTQRTESGALIYSDQQQALNYMQMARAQQAIALERQAERHRRAIQRQGNFYVPGSNGVAAGYASTPSFSSKASSGQGEVRVPTGGF